MNDAVLLGAALTLLGCEALIERRTYAEATGGGGAASPAATTTSSGASAGGGQGGEGAAPQGGAGPCAEGVVDFSTYSSEDAVYACWQTLERHDGFALTPRGHFTITPRVGEDYWFGADEQIAPMLFTEVEGSFGFAIELDVVDTGAGGPIPSAPFHGAGIALLDPANEARWILGDLARQTVPGGPQNELGNLAWLFEGPAGDFVASGQTRMELLLCRAGDRFSFHRRLDPRQPSTLVWEADEPAFGDTSWVGFTAHVYVDDPEPIEGRLFRTELVLGIEDTADCLRRLGW